MGYDVVIVGAGSAGAVLASRLSEDPATRVALIEAGPDFPDPATLPDVIKFHRQVAMGAAPLTAEPSTAHRPYEWDFVGRATDARPRVLVPRGKVVGGTSAICGSMFVRGTREDFESWVAAGNTEWSYDKVLPYYRMLETDLDFQNEFHGSSGPIAVGRVMRPSWSESDHAFEDACVALGHPASDDQNHPDATGVGPVPRIRSNGTRISTAIAFLAAARSRPNLTIIPDARARRIRIQDRRATAVEIQNGHGPATVEGDEIVLCAGAIGTPHILLLSGIGPAEQLRQNGIAVLADLPGVGRDLRDHPGVRVVWERGPGDLRNGPLYLRFTAAGSALKSDCRIVAPERSGDGLAASMVGIYLAAGRGEVRLRSADPEVAPMVDLRYLDEESDRRRMRDTVLFAIELAGQPALRRFLGQVADPGEAERATSRDLDRWIERTVRTAHHLSSTAKMGPATDRTAVVDQFGRMHGIEGLRVADASIMPDCVRHNTNKTSMMIGARAADLIRMPN